MKVKYMVLDWNPNGTNDVAIVVNDEVIDVLPELTFGIDINRYVTEEIEPDAYAASVPLKTVIEKLAVSPVHTRAFQYNRLMASINKGENQ